VNAKYASVERQVKVSAKKIRLNLECDELWSFVDHKGNKQWVWLAMDRKQEKLLEFILGNEAKKGQKLVEFLPPVYRQCAVCYTDFGSRVLVFFRRVIKE